MYKVLVLFVCAVVMFSCTKEEDPFEYNPEINSYSDFNVEYNRIVFGCNSYLYALDTALVEQSVVDAYTLFEELYPSLQVLKEKGEDLLYSNTLTDTEEIVLQRKIETLDSEISQFTNDYESIKAVYTEDIDLILYFNQVKKFISLPDYESNIETQVTDIAVAYLQNTPEFSKLAFFADRQDFATIQYFMDKFIYARLKLAPFASDARNAYVMRTRLTDLKSNETALSKGLKSLSDEEDNERIYNICVRNNMNLIGEGRLFQYNEVMRFSNVIDELYVGLDEYLNWSYYKNRLYANPTIILDSLQTLETSKNRILSKDSVPAYFNEYLNTYYPEFNTLFYLISNAETVATWMIDYNKMEESVENWHYRYTNNTLLKDDALVDSIQKVNTTVNLLQDVYNNDASSMSTYFHSQSNELYLDSAITDNLAWKLQQIKQSLSID